MNAQETAAALRIHHMLNEQQMIIARVNALTAIGHSNPELLDEAASYNPEIDEEICKLINGTYL